MDPALHKALLDRVYDKRKAATLDLEKQVRECLARGDRARVELIVQQLCALLSSSSPANVNARNGGLIGLAGISIALGVEIAPYLEQIVRSVLACFGDPDSKIRYFACESFYNIAKVCKGEILIYFNDIFDALSKLAADAELSVKNGAELLDRLLKDIVCEAAPHYVSLHQNIAMIRARQDSAAGVTGANAELDVAREKAHHVLSHDTKALEADEAATSMNRAFSLARFIPLLSERIYVISPFTRNFLVGWITVLDSIPSLELVSFLPSFLGGLLKYLSDPNTDVRIATANVLSEFLREIREAEAERVRNHAAEHQRQEKRSRREAKLAKRNAAAAAAAAEPNEPTPASTIVAELEAAAASPSSHPAASTSPAISLLASTSPRQASPAFTSDLALPGRSEKEGESELSSVVDRVDRTADAGVAPTATEFTAADDNGESDDEDIWIPGQEVRIDHSAIIEILIEHTTYPDEDIQATTMMWIAEFLVVIQHVVVPFTPRLLPAILPSLAHHSPAIANAANVTNVNLYGVIRQLPAPAAPEVAVAPKAIVAGKEKAGKERAASPTQSRSSSISGPQATDGRLSTSLGTSTPLSPRLRAHGPASLTGDASLQEEPMKEASSADPFDFLVTVNVLTLQLLDEHEETRVAALEWLLMLHRKAPRKILAMNDGTFPALLKMLSDSSDEVVRCDLRLLAQISSASEDAYFHAFMANLLSLFSTDRRLLETRGSLIIRQLCSSLHTERIFRTLAEILEKDEDLEFASVMVQTLNIILLTSPELAEFRRRLKSLDGGAGSARDGAQLFVSLYRSWSHNAVATLSLCLLAGAYEQASNLLNIFADLEITVGLLIQIDKLVQLLESPIFTALRLQLLEPERNPYLFKTLYGLLMLLPQSSAFATLRNRLNAVSSMGFMHIVPRTATTSAPSSTRSKLNAASREDVRWNELLSHFRSVQLRHERARRAANTTSMQSAAEGVTSGVERPFGALDLSTGASAASSRSPSASRRNKSGSMNTLASDAPTSRFAGAGAISSPLNPGTLRSPTPRTSGLPDGGSQPGTPQTPSFFGLHTGSNPGGSGTGAARPSSPVAIQSRRAAATNSTSQSRPTGGRLR